MVDQRVGGLPLEQVLGWVEFCGLRIAVAPGVFVPRRRTEFLVQQAIAAAATAGTAGSGNPVVVVDLCCGSGAVAAAVAVAAAGHRLDLYATDIDPVAVRCARRNLAATDAQVFEGDLDEPLPTRLRGRVDVLVANAPYVPTEGIAMMPPEARVHEPRVALDGGPDGLDVLRRVVRAAPRWLAPRGTLLVEASEGQAPQVAAAMQRTGLRPRVLGCPDLDGTVVAGTRSTG